MFYEQPALVPSVEVEEQEEFVIFVDFGIGPEVGIAGTAQNGKRARRLASLLVNFIFEVAILRPSLGSVLSNKC
ncbi:hypothetical protein [Boudabousia liubingyangii]|uniref:hypothetical protein n=1 Tax=Boudabousia liubingyangii TaxID=1921764 RepID=UPI0009394AC1|nr:hypothetical protein [Boudabousia liubingyangii]